MIGTSRMNGIEHVDVLNRYVIAEAGVVNLWVSNAVKNQGFQYAPDPSGCTGSHPKFPVDIRHNAKIGREKLAVWAARQGIRA